MSKTSLPAIDRRALLAGGTALIFAAGCSNVIGPPDAPQLYLLRPPFPPPAPGPKVGWALSVVLPDAPDSLDTSRIAISRSAGTMDFYADASWPDHLTALVQTALVEGFEHSGRIEQVAADSAGLHANYLLMTSIRDFEARYDTPDGAPTAVVSLDAKLVTRAVRQIVSHTTVSQEVPAGANTISAAVDALNRAFAAAVGQIVDWTLSAPPPAA